jgi:hypothetical protein
MFEIINADHLVVSDFDPLDRLERLERFDRKLTSEKQEVDHAIRRGWVPNLPACPPLLPHRLFFENRPLYRG